MLTNFLLSFLGLFSIVTTPLAAESTKTISNTTVMDDLYRDPKFNLDDYPEDARLQTVNAIQIAVNQNNDLYVYTCNPSANTKAIPVDEIVINDSQDYEYEEDSTSKIYKLKEINTDGIFSKYLVNGFKVPDKVSSFINLVSFYRYYDPDIDSSDQGDVAIPIEQRWLVERKNGNVKYEMKQLEVVEILDKHLGHLSYQKAFLNSNYVDVHYVAFNTNRNIDRLMEADVLYDTVDYMYERAMNTNVDKEGTETYGNKKTVKYTDKIEFSAGSLLQRDFVFSEVSTVGKFIEEADKSLFALKPKIKDKLKQYQWVLNYAKTPATAKTGAGGFAQYEGTRTKNVAVLRLKFEEGGRVYDLGVVDSKKDEPIIPDNNSTPQEVIPDWFDRLKLWFEEQGTEFMKILKVILIVVGLLLFAKPIEWIFKGLKSLIDMIFSIFDDDDK